MKTTATLVLLLAGCSVAPVARSDAGLACVVGETPYACDERVDVERVSALPNVVFVSCRDFDAGCALGAACHVAEAGEGMCEPR